MPQGQIARRGHWLPEGNALLSVAPVHQCTLSTWSRKLQCMICQIAQSAYGHIAMSMRSTGMMSVMCPDSHTRNGCTSN